MIIENSNEFSTAFSCGYTNYYHKTAKTETQLNANHTPERKIIIYIHEKQNEIIIKKKKENTNRKRDKDSNDKEEDYLSNQKPLTSCRSTTTVVAVVDFNYQFVVETSVAV